MAWQMAVAYALAGAYQGAQASKRGDEDADAIDDIIQSTLATSLENKATATKDSYADTLNSKDIISGEISNTLLQAKVVSDEIITETGGSGVLADTGGTLDVQMAVLNQARQTEDNLLTQMSMTKAKNAYEAEAKRKSIDRNTQMEVQRLQAQSRSVRQGGRDAKLQAYFGGSMNAGASYLKG